MRYISKFHDKGDPSDVKQFFTTYNIQLLCCRYWWLKKWECSELSFPYWRIYYNSNDGGNIKFNNEIIPLISEYIYIIAPNTSYSTFIDNRKIKQGENDILGGRVGQHNSEKELLDESCLLHLFIHFNIGNPFDNIVPGVFSFKLENYLKEKINIIKDQLNSDFTRFDFYAGLAVQSLIFELISLIPHTKWNLLTKDNRIVETLSFIEKNLNDKLTNEILADKVCLATNAFNRLFKNEVGVPPQRYVKSKRIEDACVQLHHTEEKIETIANNTGFADRYHFSRIFKAETGVSPAKYRKSFGFK